MLLLWFFRSLFFSKNAVVAKIIVMLLNETVIDVKFNPIGVSPRNNPVMPAMPKLNATLNTASSIMSSLFLFLNSIFTRHLPGIRHTKIMTSAERR